jgi:hypothetical protein
MSRVAVAIVMLVFQKLTERGIFVAEEMALPFKVPSHDNKKLCALLNNY